MPEFQEETTNYSNYVKKIFSIYITSSAYACAEVHFVGTMTLVNVCVYDSSCSRQLVQWTVFSIDDERMTLGSLFDMVTSRSEPSIRDHLDNHHLEESRVGSTKDVLDRVGDTSVYKYKIIII